MPLTAATQAPVLPAMEPDPGAQETSSTRLRGSGGGTPGPWLREEKRGVRSATRKLQHPLASYRLEQQFTVI